MEDTGEGLHPAVDGQSLGEGEGEAFIEQVRMSSVDRNAVRTETGTYSRDFCSDTIELHQVISKCFVFIKIWNIES